MGTWQMSLQIDKVRCGADRHNSPVYKVAKWRIRA